jgi:hypothetical protein
MSSHTQTLMPDTAGQIVFSPRWPVIVAAVSVLGSVILAVAEIAGNQASNLLISSAGYVLGSLLTTVFVVVHRLLKQRSAREIWFSPRPQLDTLAHALLVAGLACGAWHAFELATEIAKR